MAGLLLLAVVLPLVVSAVAGTLEIPRNDDWSYRRIAVDLARTGRFTLDGISTTMIVGQILLTQPLLWLSGLQPWAFTVAGAVFAIGGILGAYALARQLLPAGHAALAAALLALFPGYLAYATSYMSDVPALGAQFLCLALGAMAVRHRPVHAHWLVASVAVGLLGFSIREFAVAAPAGVLMAAIIAERGRPRIWGVAIAVAVSCVAIQVWRSTLPGQVPPVGPGYGSFWTSFQALSSVALVVAPAALIGAIKWRNHVRRIDLVIGLVLGAILIAAHLIRWAQQGATFPVILDNLTSQWGVPARGYLVGGRPLLFPDAIWMAVNGLALAATVVVASLGAGIAGTHLRRCHRSMRTLLRRVGSPAGVLVLFSLAAMGGLVFFGLSRPIFDRYFWPLVPPLAALFLFVPGDLQGLAKTPSDRRLDRALVGSAAVHAVVLATLSIVLLLNSHAFDAARWSAGQQLVRAGLAPDEIDAGYEWVGYHATSQGDPTSRTPTDPWYRRWWSSFTACGVVSSERLDLAGAELVGTSEYALNLVGGPVASLYLYRIRSAECPS